MPTTLGWIALVILIILIIGYLYWAVIKPD